MKPTFQQLNDGWNAEPNAPYPEAKWDGSSLRLTFRMNPFQFPKFERGDIGELIFEDCSRYRLGDLNDEGWYRGQGRFGRSGHQWGEFYQVSGGLDSDSEPSDWVVRCKDSDGLLHFLFYFRDEDFECVARAWTLKTTKAQQAVAPNA